MAVADHRRARRASCYRRWRQWHRPPRHAGSSQTAGRGRVRRYAPLAFSINKTAIRRAFYGGSLGPVLAQHVGCAQLCWSARDLTGCSRFCCNVARAARYRSVLARDPVVDFRDRAEPTCWRCGNIGVSRSPSPACLHKGGSRCSSPISSHGWFRCGTDLVAAGGWSRAVIAIAIPCRILWGWVGPGPGARRFVMAGLAFGHGRRACADGRLSRPRRPPRSRIVAAAQRRSARCRARRSAVGIRATGQSGPGRRGPTGECCVRHRWASSWPLGVSLCLRSTGGTRPVGGLRDPATVVGLDLLRQGGTAQRGRWLIRRTSHAVTLVQRIRLRDGPDRKGRIVAAARQGHK